MLDEIGRLSKIAYNNPTKILKAFKVLFIQGPKAVAEKLRRYDVLDDYIGYINIQYQTFLKKHYPKAVDLWQQKNLSKKFKYRPKISIITPTYNTQENFLRECIESIKSQTYDNWELCIADDASQQPYIKDVILEYAKDDARIKYIFRSKNGHISRASNSALKLATGDFVGFLDHDDILWPNAIFEVVKKLNENSEVDFIYSDEDKVEEDGKTHIEPFFKPNWSPDYLRTINYITHFTVIRRKLVNKVGGFRPGYDGAQDWDLFLRITREIKDPTRIAHIPKVLYSWRKSKFSAASIKTAKTVKAYAYRNQKKVLEDDLKKSHFGDMVIRTQNLGSWRMKYKIFGKPLVSIIIPTKDKLNLIRNCLYSILQSTSYKNFEIIIVDSGSKDKKVWNLYSYIKTLHPKVQILNWDNQFSFSKVCNFAASRSRGDYLLFLNNDTQVITKRWIENMLEHAQREEIGAVGCKLLFPNGRIQHAGIVLGIKGGVLKKNGVAGHPFKGFYNRRINPGYWIVVDCIRDTTALTASCMLISKKKFEEAGGFDPKFRISYNDVDFCIRVREKKLFNLYTPYTVLIHNESASVGRVGSKNRSLKEFLMEVDLMHKRWGKLLKHDPYYNENLTLQSEEYTIEV